MVHYLSDKRPVLKNILKACKEYNNPDRVFIYTSTSKITFAGAGIAVFASSKNNIDYMTKLLSIQTIGSNKINQLLHYRFLKSVDGIMEHMEKHARILKPKFDLVLDIFERTGRTGDRQLDQAGGRLFHQPRGNGGLRPQGCRAGQGSRCYLDPGRSHLPLWQRPPGQ